MKNRIFLSAFGFLVLSLGIITLFREPRTISALENRSLHQFPAISIHAFIRGEFQDKFERALSDQFVGSTIFKRWYNRYKLTSLRMFFDAAKPFIPKKRRVHNASNSDSRRKEVFFEATYIPKGENIFQIQESGNLVIFDYKNEYLTALKRRLETLVRDLGNIQSPLFPKYYMYYIEESRDIDFADHRITHIFSDAAEQTFREVGEFDAFTFDNLEEYQEKMYRSDHHWNHIGQIEGYENIVRLLLGENEDPLPIRPRRIPQVRFSGSLSRTVSDFTVHDDFYVGEVKLPPHEVIIAAVDETIARSYGRQEEYLKGNIDSSPEINHYGECFGQDTGLITFDFRSPDKENLLMIVDSYSNPINAWVASHFNRTYIVDLRHYEAYIGSPFSISEFVFTNEINKILFVGGGTMYRNAGFKLEPSSTSSKN